MKKIVLAIVILLLLTDKLLAAISFDQREYTPRGKNFDIKYNYLYYHYSEKTTDKIVILYFKKDNGRLIFKGFEMSGNLKEQLPELVIKYIGKYVANIVMNETQSVIKVKDAVSNSIKMALDQKYKKLLIEEGKKLVKDSAYYRGYFNSKWYMPNYYYDFEPQFSNDTINVFLMNTIVDGKFPGLKYVSDSLKHFGYHNDTKNLSGWGNVFRKVRFTKGTRTIKDYGYVKRVIIDDEAYHKRYDSCRFRLKKVAISHGKKYPTFASVSIFEWHATYCNFLASDLRESIFGSPLWETKGCKDDYYSLKNKHGFVKIQKGEIYKYSNAGYFVFLIETGHITTVYPNGEKTTIDNIDYPTKVVQAGTDTGILDLFDVWGNFATDNEIIAYVYLGYLEQ